MFSVVVVWVASSCSEPVVCVWPSTVSATVPAAMSAASSGVKLELVLASRSSVSGVKGNLPSP